jgi:predicted peptidase
VYVDVGHDSWTPTYKNDTVLDWLFKQKKEK